MAKFFDALTDAQIEFIRKQYVFFVATAPPKGRINLSPKGMDTFRVIDPHTVAYLDLTGSGIETAAHLNHDDRITFMFCSFDQTPLILRLYGTGDVIRPGDKEWEEVFQHFTPTPGQRQIIRARITSTQDSCGYGVPRYESPRERQTLRKFTEKFDPAELAAKQAEQTTSIDGLSAR